MKIKINTVVILCMVVIFASLFIIGSTIVKIHNFNQETQLYYHKTSATNYSLDYSKAYFENYEENQLTSLIASNSIYDISNDQKTRLFDIIYEEIINVEDNLTNKQQYMLKMFPGSDPNEYLNSTNLRYKIIEKLETPPYDIIDPMAFDKTIRLIPEFFKFLIGKLEEIYLMDTEQFEKKYLEALSIYEATRFEDYIP